MKKKSVVNTVPGAVFRTLHFLCDFWMGEISFIVFYTRLERLARDKHSSLLRPFISYEENKVL
jgi:hypothetical protein